ncbi:MAG: BON domain-containing protein [Leptolyngbya sp. IPPAS B-1204]|nr:BON domain-containing protein [Elainella sp. C42_A2020_010]RNJ69357.1 MAG: BON domain-containing protein [Leptolyngbya sp. IPPAS B-1204]
MSWLQRVFSLMHQSSFQPEAAVSSYTLSLNSVSNPTDWLPQPKESQPAYPLEYVGLNGEYDPQGLAKRVAQALDQHPQVQNIKTLCIIQHGNRITLLGKVTSAAQLRQVVEVVEQVAGVKDVDVDQVTIGQLKPTASTPTLVGATAS